LISKRPILSQEGMSAFGVPVSAPVYRNNPVFCQIIVAFAEMPVPE